MTQLLLGWATGGPGQNWAIRNGPMSDQDTATKKSKITITITIHIFVIDIISIIFN